jgi:chromosome segregation ATPase
MTEHLKKQIDHAAAEVRAAKEKIDSANKSIESNQVAIKNNECQIESLESSIDYLRAANTEVVEKRDAAFFELAQAQKRLGFFMSELVLHPYVAA